MRIPAGINWLRANPLGSGGSSPYPTSSQSGGRLAVGPASGFVGRSRVLFVVDLIVLVAALGIPVIAVARRWRFTWLVSLASVWVGLYLWDLALMALDDERDSMSAVLWMMLGWAAALIWVVILHAVRDQVDRHRVAQRP